MVKHIIAAVAAFLTIAAVAYMAQLDMEVNKLKLIEEVIEKSKQEVKTKQTQKAISLPKEESEEEKKLKVLKEKAGRMSAFEVSPLFRRNCASCHGINGEGGIGPKLIGKDEAYILKALEDFKSGKRKNYVMFGLLRNMKDEELKSLAKEISQFASKMKNN
jgi:cytochrome c553